MEDLISRSALLAAYDAAHKGPPGGARKLIEEAPDGIVRCKYCTDATMTADGKLCKYCGNDTDENGYPREVYHDANWFCPEGRRG